jgi:hypothetical protein
LKTAASVGCFCLVGPANELPENRLFYGAHLWKILTTDEGLEKAGHLHDIHPGKVQELATQAACQISQCSLPKTQRKLKGKEIANGQNVTNNSHKS